MSIAMGQAPENMQQKQNYILPSQANNPSLLGSRTHTSLFPIHTTHAAQTGVEEKRSTPGKKRVTDTDVPNKRARQYPVLN